MPERIYLENPSRRRMSEFLTLAQQSRSFHRGWVSAPTTETAFLTYLTKCRVRSFRGFLACTTDDRVLAGVANLSEIVGGGFQNAYLGFYAFSRMSNRGYMTEALGLVLDAAFGEMKLHRLEANIQPSNAPSIRLVNKLGFRLEDYSPKYLKIGGRWRDHERWAILAQDWR